MNQRPVVMPHRGPEPDATEPRCFCGGSLLDWCEADPEALWVCEQCGAITGLGCGECDPCTELYADGRRLYEALRREAEQLARERREPYAVALVDGQPQVVPVYAVVAPIGERMDADCWDARTRRDRFARGMRAMASCDGSLTTAPFSRALRISSRRIYRYRMKTARRSREAMTTDDDKKLEWKIKEPYRGDESADASDVLRCLEQQRMAARAERKGRSARGYFAELELYITDERSMGACISIATPDGDREVEERLGHIVGTAAVEALNAWIDRINEAEDQDGNQ